METALKLSRDGVRHHKELHAAGCVGAAVDAGCYGLPQPGLPLLLESGPETPRSHLKVEGQSESSLGTEGIRRVAEPRE